MKAAIMAIVCPVAEAGALDGADPPVGTVTLVLAVDGRESVVVMRHPSGGRTRHHLADNTLTNRITKG
jgi:hypothetical protein